MTGAVVQGAVVSNVSDKSMKLVVPKGIIEEGKTFRLRVEIQNSFGNIKQLTITNIKKVPTGTQQTAYTGNTSEVEGIV